MFQGGGGPAGPSRNGAYSRADAEHSGDPAADAVTPPNTSSALLTGRSSPSDGRLTVCPSTTIAVEPPPSTNWKGREAIGVKLHLPSRILFYNVRDLETGQPGKIERGNILTWEQWLKDRRIGTPLVMEMAMEGF